MIIFYRNKYFSFLSNLKELRRGFSLRLNELLIEVYYSQLYEEHSIYNDNFGMGYMVFPYRNGAIVIQWKRHDMVKRRLELEEFESE